MDPAPILISIKPAYAEAILSGKKTVEFRKASFPKRVGTMVLYATSPVKRIAGTVKVGAVVVLGTEGAGRRYHERGAIERRAFNDYYEGAGRKAHGTRVTGCIELEEAHRLEPPIDPYKVVKTFWAPQSFRYLKAGSPFVPSRP